MDEINQIYKMAKSYVKKHNYRITQIDYDDVIQELVEYAYDRYSRIYDSEKGSLSTFVYKAFEWKYNKLINKDIALSNKYNKNFDIETVKSDSIDVLTEMIQEERFNKIKRLVNKETWDYYYIGLSQKEIASKYGISQSSVSKRIKENLEFIRGELNEI